LFSNKVYIDKKISNKNRRCLTQDTQWYQNSR